MVFMLIAGLFGFAVASAQELDSSVYDVSGALVCPNFATQVRKLVRENYELDTGRLYYGHASGEKGVQDAAIAAGRAAFSEIKMAGPAKPLAVQLKYGYCLQQSSDPVGDGLRGLAGLAGAPRRPRAPVTDAPKLSFTVIARVYEGEYYVSGTLKTVVEQTPAQLFRIDGANFFMAPPEAIVAAFISAASKLGRAGNE